MHMISDAELAFTCVERVAEFSAIEAEPLYHDKGGGVSSVGPGRHECYFKSVISKVNW